MEHIVNILKVEKIAPNTYNLLVVKPKGYTFIPGQYASISINKPHLKMVEMYFSFTGITEWDYLEFIIKSCNPFINEIIKLKTSDSLIIRTPRGNLRYKGMGTFIAGGTGITPFISIFRSLRELRNLSGNKLIYSNKTIDDVIINKELLEMFGNDYTNLFTKNRYQKYYFGRIDKNFLRMVIVDFAQYFYISGSQAFVQSVNSILQEFEIAEDSIIFEQILNQNSNRALY